MLQKTVSIEDSIRQYKADTIRVSIAIHLYLTMEETHQPVPLLSETLQSNVTFVIKLVTWRATASTGPRKQKVLGDAKPIYKE